MEGAAADPLPLVSSACKLASAFRCLPSGVLLAPAESACDCKPSQLWQRFWRVERVTGIEPALSAWEW
jgi:hypothetical protein